MALGAAIRTARGRTTQEKLAELLETDQSRVSKWERDHHRPSLEEVRAIEDALGRPRGFILVQAGLVELPQGLEDQIALDERLSDGERELLLASLSGLLARHPQ